MGAESADSFPASSSIFDTDCFSHGHQLSDQLHCLPFLFWLGLCIEWHHLPNTDSDILDT